LSRSDFTRKFPAWLAGAFFLVAGCAQTSTSIRQEETVQNLPSCTRPRVVASRTYLAFFDLHSAILTERGRIIVTEFAKNQKVLVAEVQGNVDASETSHQDNGLGMRRAKAVSDVLVELGVPAEHILTRDFGPSRPLVPTPPGTAEPQNRRVAVIPLASYHPGEAEERQKCASWLIATYCPTVPGSPASLACRYAVGNLEYSQ
jgi:hypothetical protein